MACLQQTPNSAKTELMLIGSRQKLSTLSELTPIDNVLIKQVSSSKSRGILINDNLAYRQTI